MPSRSNSGGSCCGGSCSGGSSPANTTTQEPKQAACSCEGAAKVQEKWVTGFVNTPAGDIPQVSTRLDFSDVWGSWKCRWSIGRMDYTVEPGLYCVGNPDASAPVLVTANYKMTFDRVRMELAGVNAWIMVLDTDGVNVWCSAGKGTFGTEEVVRRIGAVKLGTVVSHRKIVLPQLGATGVAAHEVARQSGFHVVYGPVRASDIKTFLASGMKATEEMRTVRFTIADRLVLSPLELVGALKPAAIVFGIMFILNAIGLGHYGTVDLYALLGAVAAGCVITPALLPWIPGKAFAFKGFLLGLLWAIGVNLMNGFPAMPDYGWLKAIAYFLVLPSLSAFCAMNFTGSSTYTSLSGVDKEMKIALPSMLISTAIGVILLLVNDFIKAFC